VKYNDRKSMKRKGDVLGISDAPPDVAIPRATDDRGGHPEGIEVRPERKRHWGNEDIQPSSGATGIDMGAGGTGTGRQDVGTPKGSEDA
jgi:hypothetical protein